MNKTAKVVIVFILLFALGISYNMVLTRMRRNTAYSLDAGALTAKRINFIHWGNFPPEVINDFSKKHSGIVVNYQKVDGENYSDTLRTKIACDDDIDVMGIKESDYADFVGKGYLVDLSGKEFLNNYREDVRTALRGLDGEGREYAVAYESYVYGIWYNKILFEKYNLAVPHNYDEFLKVCGVLKKNGTSPLILGARDDWNAGLLYLLGEQSGDSASSGSKASQLPDSGMKQALKDLSTFVDFGYIAKNSINLTYQQAFSEFSRGRAAMMITGDSAVNLVKDDIDLVCDPGVFQLPCKGAGLDDLKVAGSKTDFLTGVFTESKNEKDAEDFIEYLSSPETAQIYLDATMSVPNIKGVETGGLKYNDLWDPLRSKNLISPFSSLLDNNMHRLMNKGAKELIIKSKTYSQIYNELQKAQD
jgi:ABC-type glycerol-3-phosphate transport system substrate-binding protein